MKRRPILKLSVSLILLVCIATYAGALYLDHSLNQRYEYTFVVGAPESALTHFEKSPYSGSHPAQFERPVDPFNYPIRLGQIGPIDTLFAGPRQYPFLCGIERSRMGQPLIDNQQGFGIPVYQVDPQGEVTDQVEGFSKDCLITTRASYFYHRLGTHKLFPLEEANNDIAKIKIKGKEIDFVVRLEIGTINRFIYAIAVLRGENEQLDKPNANYWNGRLIYQFRGGVGIGRKQGNFKPRHLFKRRFEQLKDGYAVVYSTANQTSNHYNIWLAEDTALRVKKQFVSLYGEPDYTVGIGGSGGAIQQYLIAQNNPQLLDAIIPLYSYPDMLSQTINILDCELQEYYFDVTDVDNPKWSNWKNRSLIEGFNAVAGGINSYSWLQNALSILSGESPNWSMGKTECVEGWRALTALVNNPKYQHYEKYFSPEVFAKVHWTYWEDMKYFFGSQANGYANSTWDNVGVQYGLSSLLEDKITIEEFIKLNHSIGSWKKPENMHREKYWIFGGKYFPLELSVWSHHNMRLTNSAAETPAPRAEANLAAIEGAYRSGNIFLGKVDLPIIDLRHYLDDELDMHHAMASFSSRQRIMNANGHADNQLIWMTKKPHMPFKEAFALIDHWMTNIKTNPQKSIAENKPQDANDSCFDTTGSTLAKGITVWDGEWNKRPTGACQKVYPAYKSSRQIAGAGISEDVFKCALIDVDEAISLGIYSGVNIKPYQLELQRVFPQGVCDYSQADLGRPENLFSNEIYIAKGI